jgi:hypothetical protein
MQGVCVRACSCPSHRQQHPAQVTVVLSMHSVADRHTA